MVLCSSALLVVRTEMATRMVSRSFCTSQESPFHTFVSGGFTEVSTHSCPMYGFSGGVSDAMTSQMLVIVICPIARIAPPPYRSTTTMKVALVSTSAVPTESVFPVFEPFVPQAVSTAPSLSYFVQV